MVNAAAAAAAAADTGAAAAAAAVPQPPQRPKVELVGYTNFKRHNPRSDKFGVHKFHHVEFWCADATNTFKRCVRRAGVEARGEGVTSRRPRNPTPSDRTVAGRCGRMGVDYVVHAAPLAH
jgi:hypothetical protein